MLSQLCSTPCVVYHTLHYLWQRYRAHRLAVRTTVLCYHIPDATRLSSLIPRPYQPQHRSLSVLCGEEGLVTFVLLHVDRPTRRPRFTALAMACMLCLLSTPQATMPRQLYSPSSTGNEDISTPHQVQHCFILFRP